MKILVTGGAGFIGSHVCVELINAGHSVVVVDNFCNSYFVVLNRISTICKATVMGNQLDWQRCDLLDVKDLNDIFDSYGPFDAVIHLAGHKSVAESTRDPVEYYHNNIAGTTTLLRVMNKHRVSTLIFSSSATVYDTDFPLPFSESSPTIQDGNAYAMSKAMIERILWDVPKDYVSKICALRYFNPVGAHKSNLLGEDPKGTPNNLMPLLLQVASGKRDKLLVYGGDYQTIDGTPARDYVHVVDVAQGHLKALEFLSNIEEHTGCVFNLGTGKSTTVLQMIESFEFANKVKIPFEIVDRRSGDVAESYADPSMARQVLKWKPEFNLDDMCRDAWNWQQWNPRGYQ